MISSYHKYPLLQVKCEEYWPTKVGETIHPGNELSVTLTSMTPYAEYCIRKMTVSQVS